MKQFRWLVLVGALTVAIAGCGGGSSGPASVSVPNVVGDAQGAAATALTAAGLAAGTVTMQSSTTVAAGTVLSESPAAGTSVAHGTAVSLVVSSGPPAVTVPNVVGETSASATTAITGAGLTVGIVTMQASSTVATGNVIGENPAAGATLATGSAVNLTVSNGATAAIGFVYVANDGADANQLGSLSVYSLDPTSGALAALAASPLEVPASNQLWETKIDPSGNFLCVLDYRANTVHVFAISPVDGTLTQVAGSPFVTGTGPESLAFDASGAFLYVATGADTIWAYALNPVSGALQPLTGSPFAMTGTDLQPQQMVAAGGYLYVANSAANSIDVFAINASTGALTEGVPGSPFATDAGPYSIAVNAAGTVLYTANAGPTGAGSISAYTISGSSGVLTAVAGNPLSIPVVNNIGIDRQGKYLLVTEAAGVAVYPFDPATGVLGMAAAGSPFPAGTDPNSFAFDSTDTFVYVGNDGSADVSEFTLDIGTGVLTPVAGSPVNAGTYPDFIAVK